MRSQSPLTDRVSNSIVDRGSRKVESLERVQAEQAWEIQEPRQRVDRIERAVTGLQENISNINVAIEALAPDVSDLKTAVTALPKSSRCDEPAGN